MQVLTVQADQFSTRGLYPGGDNFTVIASLDKETVETEWRLLDFNGKRGGRR